MTGNGCDLLAVDYEYGLSGGIAPGTVGASFLGWRCRVGSWGILANCLTGL